LDIHQIQALLPHRYPFLLVDRVVEMSADRVVGLKNVTANEPFFQGHFPGQPVMPGVLLVEALAQAGALLACKATGFDPSKQVIYFMGMDKVKFRKRVIPGDQVLLEVVPLRKGAAVWKMRGEAKVAGEVVCEAEFLATLAKRDAAP
jgi:3-hydroxyacyl-[acyl-carrier-protein] dehydratase